jgi:hypothetical protein
VTCACMHTHDGTVRPQHACVHAHTVSAPCSMPPIVPCRACSLLELAWPPVEVNTPRGGSEEEELLRRVVPADRPEPDQLPCRLYGRRHHRTLCSYYYVVFTYKHCTFAFTSYSLTLLCACRYIYIHTMHARSSSICVAGTAANVSVLDDTNYINLGSA